VQIEACPPTVDFGFREITGDSFVGAHLRSDFNIRSRHYFIAEAISACGCCGDSTRVVALALPPGHELLGLDEGAEREEFAQDIWESAPCNAFLFYVEHLSDSVQHRLKERSTDYRLVYSASTLGSYWANHCEKCGSLLEDHELFCEPEGAFLPASEARATDIKLLRVEEPLEAAAAGYAQEPEFFSSMEGGEGVWLYIS
jgi:hypothetical protein